MDTLTWAYLQRIRQAVSSVLGNAGDVAHEALVMSIDVLRFAPIAGLSDAARILLSIWDAVQKVDVRDFPCFCPLTSLTILFYR